MKYLTYFYTLNVDGKTKTRAKEILENSILEIELKLKELYKDWEYVKEQETNLKLVSEITEEITSV